MRLADGLVDPIPDDVARFERGSAHVLVECRLGVGRTEHLDDLLDGNGCGNLTRRMPPHPVGHQKHRHSGLDPPRIFVVGTDLPGVGCTSEAQEVIEPWDRPGHIVNLHGDTTQTEALLAADPPMGGCGAPRVRNPAAGAGAPP